MHENQVELTQRGRTAGAAVRTEARHVGQLEERLAGEVVRRHKVVIHNDEVYHPARRYIRRNRAESKRANTIRSPFSTLFNDYGQIHVNSRTKTIFGLLLVN